MADEKKKKPKRPTALKRDIQNEKRRMLNKSFKAKVRTATREFQEACQKNDSAAITQSLGAVYSLMDKGVKRGIYKINKANRVKAQAAAKVAKAS